MKETKTHITSNYNGMERIASRLGDQNLPINVNDPDLQDRKDWQDSLIRRNVTEITGYEFLPVGEEQNHEDPKPVFELPQMGLNNLTPIGSGDVFYYHPNHLGSTCYVTDENASVVQGFLYAPFGEITNEHNSGFGSSVLPKYSFNAKELDEETGMYYYEARYMAPPTFISRDPLFEKYPTFSPYAYCVNNPIKYVDPDGRDFDPETDKKYIMVYEREINERIKYYDNLRGTDKWNDSYNEQYDEYKNILSEIKDLREDKNNLYTVRTGMNLNNDDGRFSYGGVLPDGKRQMYVDIADKATNVCLIMGIMAHELKHAHQYYNEELGFVLENGVQVNSSCSKQLEQQAHIREQMFSGCTMLNNGHFKLINNLKWQSYELNKYYDGIPEVTHVKRYSIFFGNDFIYNKKQ